MDMVFLDSSALVKRYVAEVGSAWVRSFSSPGLGTVCFLAPVTPVEIVAALYRRVRTGTASLADVQLAEASFRMEMANNFRKITFDLALVQKAMELVAIHSLRGYDALQLASALFLQGHRTKNQSAPITFISADANLNNAAQAEGLLVDDPNLHP